MNHLTIDKSSVRLKFQSALSATCLLLLVAFPSALLRAQPASAPRNIISIVFDDADFFDFGFANATLLTPDVSTPNIDRLAANGRVFTNYFAASSICTPSRASLLTARSPLQFGIFDTWPSETKVFRTPVGLNGLPSGQIELGTLMQSLGKSTAHHGKWHLGLHQEQHRPKAHGYDHFSFRTTAQKPLLFHSGITNFFTHAGDYVLDTDYVDYQFTDAVINSIEEFEANDKGFYINFWPFTPHAPWVAPRDFDNSQFNYDLSTKRGNLLAMMQTIDAEIGRIISKLEDLGILEDTLILLTSDNGGQQSVQAPGGFNGAKGSLLEGGVHVPLIAHWPNGIEPNTLNDTIITSYDLLPTLVALLGYPPEDLYPFIDGRSKAAAFLSDSNEAHEPIVWQLAGNAYRLDDERGQKTFAIRDGDFKLVKLARRNDLSHRRAYLLFNVALDPFETTNVADSYPELVATLKAQMLQLRAERSLFSEFPSEAINQRVYFANDARIDISSGDMTMVFDLDVPPRLNRDRQIFNRAGSHRISLTKRLELNWRLVGVDIAGFNSFREMTSDPLSPGIHRVRVTVHGFKFDTLRAEAYIDEQLIWQLDSNETVSDIYKIRESHTQPVLGDLQLGIRNAVYFNNHFYPDEIAALNLPTDWPANAQ